VLKESQSRQNTLIRKETGVIKAVDGLNFHLKKGETFGLKILILLMPIRQRVQLTFLIISHDLAVVAYVSTIIGVMNLGRLVELPPAVDL